MATENTKRLHVATDTDIQLWGDSTTPMSLTSTPLYDYTVHLEILELLRKSMNGGVRYYECLNHLNKSQKIYTPNVVTSVLVDLERSRVIRYDFSRGAYLPSTAERVEEAFGRFLDANSAQNQL